MRQMRNKSKPTKACNHNNLPECDCGYSNRGSRKKAATYLQRWQQLWARYERTNSNSDWAGFIDWLISRRSTLRPATWRQYRAAVVHAMGQQQVLGRESFHARLMERINLPDRKVLPARTSSTKSKSLPNADMNALIQHLGARDGRWDRLTGLWLVFGMITGLRPGEWQHVKAYPGENEMILRVANAKFDTQRANGPERTIHVRIPPPCRAH